MKIRKALLVTGAASAVGLSTIAGIGVANAQTTNGNGAQNGSNGVTSLVDEIAQKFNLNKQDVQSVFDKHHQEHEAANQQKLKTRLDKLVSEGKITSSQETLILNKLQEFQTFKDSLKGKTAAERKTLMDQEQASLQQWAKDNNIPTNLVPFLGGPRHDVDHDND